LPKAQQYPLLRRSKSSPVQCGLFLPLTTLQKKHRHYKLCDGSIGNTCDSYARYRERWIPAFAGMTVFVGVLKFEGW
jgi:hypothetical protein